MLLTSALDAPAGLHEWMISGSKLHAIDVGLGLAKWGGGLARAHHHWGGSWVRAAHTPIAALSRLAHCKDAHPMRADLAACGAHANDRTSGLHACAPSPHRMQGATFELQPHLPRAPGLLLLAAGSGYTRWCVTA